jgi:ligand-binding sensor domain-containing protein
VIYAGTWHLAWKTTDGGKHWVNLKQGVIEDSDVFSIIVDPKQPSTVYLSACSGIYKSVNSGGQFTGGVGVNKSQGIPSTARRTRVLMQDPNNLDTVFAGTTEGLYRTFDAGKYWVQTTNSDVIVNDVYIDPQNSKHVLLATDRRGVLASEDGGDSFVPANKGFSARQITAYSGDAQHAATVYVGVVNDKDSGGVFVSHTGGLSWTHLSAGLDGHDVFSLGQAPDGTMLAGTEHGMYRLRDSLWQRVGDDAAMPAQRPGVLPSTIVKSGKRPVQGRRPAKAANAQVLLQGFDGSVYGFAATGDAVVAATSQGVLRSTSNGATWSAAVGLPIEEWRFVAAAKGMVVAASLRTIEASTDGAMTWKPIALPPKMTQIYALSVDGQGEVWVGDHDGVYVSADRGATWQAQETLVVRSVNSLFYDEQGGRMLVTARDPETMAYAVDVRTKQVSSWDTGWNLRFVRPVGDHLVAATLFDGMVVQPRMVDSADVAKQ